MKKLLFCAITLTAVLPILPVNEKIVCSFRNPGLYSLFQDSQEKYFPLELTESDKLANLIEIVSLVHARYQQPKISKFYYFSKISNKKHDALAEPQTHEKTLSELGFFSFSPIIIIPELTSNNNDKDDDEYEKIKVVLYYDDHTIPNTTV